VPGSERLSSPTCRPTASEEGDFPPSELKIPEPGSYEKIRKHSGNPEYEKRKTAHMCGLVNYFDFNVFYFRPISSSCLKPKFRENT